MKEDKVKKIIGIILLVAGCGLSYWGYTITQSIGSKFNKLFSGAHSDKAVILIICGVVCIAVGLYQLYKEFK